MNLTDKAFLSFERGRGILTTKLAIRRLSKPPVGYSYDENGDRVLHDEFFKIPVLRELSYERRVRACASQYLVYRNEGIYIQMIHSKISQSYLCGVKHHPFLVPSCHTIEEDDICECCPPPVVLKTINMSRLQSHMRTRKHICTKWKVDTKDMLEGAKLLRVKLKMLGVHV